MTPEIFENIVNSKLLATNGKIVMKEFGNLGFDFSYNNYPKVTSS
jgi:hypothetical protein